MLGCELAVGAHPCMLPCLHKHVPTADHVYVWPESLENTSGGIIFNPLAVLTLKATYKVVRPKCKFTCRPTD